MIFSSLTFVFTFLGITALLYFAVPNLHVKNAVLLIASLVFYSWGEPRLVVLMLITAFVAYIGGIVIDKAKTLRKLFFAFTCIIILSGLLVFKYLDFICDTIGFVGPGLSLPIGISFYTFQILSYVIDFYRGEVVLQKNYFKLLLYVSFFPQLIAGPIVRYSTVESEISSRVHSVDDVAAGIRRFILGLAKKCLIANGVAQAAELIYAGDPTVYGTLGYWYAAVCYALQIYFDFSGYSDMAIGLGRIFGFHFLENFDHPYFSASVTEFWRRWHISLSSWFRDYVYIPLGGNRVSKPRWIFNILVVWGLTGLWHGASWNFVIWGLYYAFFLVVEKMFLNKLLSKTKIISHLYTIAVILVGWVIFNLTDFSQLLSALTQMFCYVPTNVFNVIAQDAAIADSFIYLPLAVLSLFAQPIVDFLEHHEYLGNIVCLVLFAACVYIISSSNYNPFIYFRF